MEIGIALSRLQAQIFKKTEQISIRILYQELLITSLVIVHPIPFFFYFPEYRPVSFFECTIQIADTGNLYLEVNSAAQRMLKFPGYPCTVFMSNAFNHNARTVNCEHGKIIFRPVIKHL